MGIGIQYSLKGRRITMIRLMGLVELRPVGSLKREAAPDNVTDSNTPSADTNDDGEGYMAKAQLMSLNKQSGELYNMLSDNEELEAWIQSKITKASDYINAAYNYLQYEKNKANTIGNGEGASADPSMPTDDGLNERVRTNKRK
jgi:hypothetical protein